MKKILVAWVLIISSMFGCTYPVGYKSEGVETFSFVCEKIAERYEFLSCDELAQPIVVKSSVVGDDYYGFYFAGEEYIFVNRDLTNAETDATVVHETVHYVVDWLGILVGRCEGERMAREITSQYTGDPISPTWEKIYRCDKKYIGLAAWMKD